MEKASAYATNLAVGDTLPEMPLFPEPHACVNVPLESTYGSAFSAMPDGWRTILEGSALV
jgi:hypothetical protein